MSEVQSKIQAIKSKLTEIEQQLQEMRKILRGEKIE